MSSVVLSFYEECHNCPNRKGGCYSVCPTGIKARENYQKSRFGDQQKRDAVTSGLYAQRSSAVNRSTNRGTRRFNYR